MKIKKPWQKRPWKEETRTRRFWTKVQKTDTCWFWVGKLIDGYGALKEHGKIRGAHRKSYELCRGKIPDGLQIDHLCRVKNCVNPDHLEAVTQKENVLRGIGPTAINNRATKCKNGHEFNKENTYYRTGKELGGRACRICRKINVERFHAKHI